MQQAEVQKKYPTLFAPIDNRAATGQFEFSAELPPENLIGNVYLVPRVGDDWLYLVEESGRLQFPGGKKEPGENHLDVIRRELIEEAGAELDDFRVVGAWHTHMKSEKPLHAHLPHPESYGLVGVGTVKVICAPSNPEGAGKMREVHTAPLAEVLDALRNGGRDDLADLYSLAVEVSSI